MTRGITTNLQNNIATVLSRENDKTLTNIDNRLEELQTQLLKLASSKADYEDAAEEIYRLREQKQKAQVENAGRDEQRKRIADMSAFLQEQPTTITEYDEQLVRHLIEKVTVYEDKLKFIEFYYNSFPIVGRMRGNIIESLMLVVPVNT